MVFVFELLQIKGYCLKGQYVGIENYRSTDVVNVVSRRKLQHFSHVVRDQNVCCVTFLKAAQPMRKLS